MTGPSGNRQIYLPREIHDRLPKSSSGGDPESLRAKRSAYYPRDQSLFVNITWTDEST